MGEYGSHSNSASSNGNGHDTSQELVPLSATFAEKIALIMRAYQSAVGAEPGAATEEIES